MYRTYVLRVRSEKRFRPFGQCKIRRFRVQSTLKTIWWGGWVKYSFSYFVFVYISSGQLMYRSYEYRLLMFKCLFFLNGKICLSIPGTFTYIHYTLMQKLNFDANASKLNIWRGSVVQKSGRVYPMRPTYYLSWTKKQNIIIFISLIYFKSCAPLFGPILKIAKSK